MRMATLTTPRLLLLPLTGQMMTTRLETDDFMLVVEMPDGPPRDVRFGPQWPGDALAIFPTLLSMMGEGPHVEGSYVVVSGKSGDAVGQVGTKGGVGKDGALEIGYGMNESVWGRGVATEAVAALVEELLRWPDVDTVTAKTAVGNIGSQRVLAKNGFARTGTGWSGDDGDLIVWSR
jgi:ribosomal-protein-alanine N-acetyltransferase